MIVTPYVKSVIQDNEDWTKSGHSRFASSGGSSGQWCLKIKQYVHFLYSNLYSGSLDEAHKWMLLTRVLVVRLRGHWIVYYS